MCGCLSRLSLCGPVMDWRPVQGVSRLSPGDCWDRLQPPRDPTDGISGYRKWMDGADQSDLTRLLGDKSASQSSVFTRSSVKS